MTIRNFEQDQFVETLQSKLSVRSPVKSIERLFGRDKELELVEEALFDEGGHVFIYGDRGVGKSSLAASVAAQYQSSDNEPIQIPCGKDTCFYKTIEEVAERILRRAGGRRDLEFTHTVNLKLYKLQVKDTERSISIPNIDSMFSAVDVLEEVVRVHSDRPIVVIDEFDQIESAAERAKFAHFLKDLGDRGVNVKFIFTGIASSLYQLLGDHESSFRQLFTLKLERLYWSYREDIAYSAIKAFGLEVDEEIVHSISRISNGFPYFVHLLTQNLLWAVFKDEQEVRRIERAHFDSAIKRSIVGISGRLQKPYDSAVLHKNHDYLLALWATADSEDTVRYSDNIFKSYLRINRQIFGVEPSDAEKPLEPAQFKKILKKFLSKDYGEVLELVEGREHMYSYRENLLRGFVALKAQEAGLELQGDTPDEPRIPTAMAKSRFSGAPGRLSVYASDPSKHVKFRSER
ncbi:ATP-binding protein [Pseudomonas delhiensis]|uniref:ATP-binding protein n=1 Tax=Pseudomonas delhiensis TaxID=366289 RepID=UPI00315B36A2